MNLTQVKTLNELIKHCVWHGGDPGGPYFSNMKRVITTCTLFCNEFPGINFELIDEIPQFTLINSSQE